MENYVLSPWNASNGFKRLLCKHFKQKMKGEINELTVTEASAEIIGEQMSSNRTRDYVDA